MNTVRYTLEAYERLWPQGFLNYEGFDAKREAAYAGEISRFVRKHDAHALERECREGHITASALVVNPCFDKVLLMLHAKLQKWLQLGGHVDGDTDLAASALREAREESGREDVELFRWETYFDLAGDIPLAFDCDVHQIPARKNEAEHFHYDLRYLCILDDAKAIERNEESHDLRWLSLEEARRLTSEVSMLRQFAKLEALRPRFLS